MVLADQLIQVSRLVCNESPQMIIFGYLADVAELVDTLDPRSNVERRRGSSPLIRIRESVNFLISITCYGLIEVKPEF